MQEKSSLSRRGPRRPHALHDLNVMQPDWRLIGKQNHPETNDENCPSHKPVLATPRPCLCHALAGFIQAQKTNKTVHQLWSLQESVERSLGPFCRKEGPALLHEGKILVIIFIKIKMENGMHSLQLKRDFDAVQ